MSKISVILEWGDGFQRVWFDLAFFKRLNPFILLSSLLAEAKDKSLQSRQISKSLTKVLHSNIRNSIAPFVILNNLSCYLSKYKVIASNETIFPNTFPR